jgi:hypothetical protein
MLNRVLNFHPSFLVISQAIAAHVESLRSWTYQQLTALQHSNGAPLVQLFGRHADGLKHESGIFQFQVCEWAWTRQLLCCCLLCAAFI